MTELKERIAHIMRSKNLTATQFADMLQIQRSGISHFLSGRNKPSLDFFMKLKDTFPEFNLDWLIMGKGPITVSDLNWSKKEEKVPSDLFFGQSESFKQEEKVPEQSIPLNFPDKKESSIEEKFQLIDKQEQKIKKILLIYQNDTFDVLFSNEK